MKKLLVCFVIIFSFHHSYAQLKKQVLLIDSNLAADTANIQNRDIRFADLNGDGYQDLILSCWFPTGPNLTSTDSIFMYENDGSGNYINRKLIYTKPSLGNWAYIIDFVFIDMNYDQILDLVVGTDKSGKHILWLQNDGSGNFSNPYTIVDSPAGRMEKFNVTTSRSLLTPDIVIKTSNDLFILINDSAARKWTLDTIVSVNNNIGIVSSVIDGSDLYALVYENNSLNLNKYSYFSYTSSYVEKLDSNLQFFAARLFITDFDNDYNKDILITEGSFYIKKNLSGSYGPLTYIASYNNFRSFGDVNADGFNDIIELKPKPNSTTPDLSYRENLRNGSYGSSILLQENYVMFELYRIGVLRSIDFDNDNDVDFLTRNGDTIFLLENYSKSSYKGEGKVFLDENRNKNFDSNERLLDGIKATDSNSRNFNFTNEDGEFSIDVYPYGTSVITLDSLSSWEITTDSLDYSFNSSHLVPSRLNLDFGIARKDTISRFNTTLVGGFPRCNSTTNYYIEVSNVGGSIIDGRVELQLDPSITFNSASLAPDSIVGNKVYWRIDSINYFDKIRIRCDVTMPNFTSIGSTLFSSLIVKDHSSTVIHSDSLSQVLRCSYDPNDKTVSPIGEGIKGYVNKKEDLEYLIRFQNTGNDTAYNVVITDRLKNIDPLSFQMISSSHSVSVDIDKAELVSFVFNNIKLVDSITNEKESHGFVKFKVQPRDYIRPNTKMSNTAKIYFDGNPAVITNTVSNHIECYDTSSVSFRIFDNYLKVLATGYLNKFQWYYNSALLNSESDTVVFRGDGVYKSIVTSQYGCQSVSELYLDGDNVINNCDDYFWPLNGSTYNSSGIYFDTITTNPHRDSITVLSLEIKNNTSSTFTSTFCGTYAWQGMNLTQSGTYHDTIPNSGGCDSLMTLNLTLSNSTSSSLSAASCGAYTWQGMSLTQSGTYHDTIQNSGGCDSLMTLNLIVGNSTSSSLSATSCGAYTWQGMSLTQSGTYHDTIQNSGGCDSLMTLSLTLGNSTSSSLSATSCGAYTWQGMSLTQSGTYHDTISNSGGCDSLMTLNLTLSNSTSSSLSATSCGAYTWQGMSLTQSGTYHDTIQNSGGCDSLMTLNLTLSNSTNSSLSATSCGVYAWQGMNLTQSGTYHDTIQNSGGCDSLMTLSLNIDTNTSSVTSISSCGTFNWRGNNYSQTGIYFDTIPNANGCDSLMTFKLFLLNSDKSVAINNDTLLSNQTFGRYQWLDCSANFAPLLNDTNQYFVPSRNGSYAVEINNGNCTDTSSCILVTTVGVANPKIELSEVSLFPNPSNGLLNISFSETSFSGSVELKDLNGRLLMVKDLSSTTIYSFELNQPPGVYLITLKTINETKSYKVLLR